MHNATTHIYEVRPRRDKRGFDPISDALPFGCLWYTQVSHAIGYAEFYSRSHDAVIRVYESASHGRHMRRNSVNGASTGPCEIVELGAND
jgi:hypothetical protein